MIIVDFEATDGERVIVTGPSLEGILKSLKGDEMNDKTWTIRTVEVA